jgi:hypothetical protein
MVKILKHSFFMLNTLLKDLCTGCIKCADTEILAYTGYTQKNVAVLILNTIKTAPLFCVCPVFERLGVRNLS